MSTIARVVQSVLLTAIVGLVAAPAANAGRLIETGHDIDLHCADQDEECHFVRVAVDYVRAGAPNPSKPILVLDRLDLDVSRALVKAYAPAAPPPSTVVDPRSPAFTTTPIDTNHWSAIFVASDITCGGCDLNDFPSGTTAVTADSTAIAARTADIAAFFDAGGGILAGAGGDNAGGGTTSFGTTNVPYYSFVATSGAGPVTGPFAVT